jgi:hypothetical protein
MAGSNGEGVDEGRLDIPTPAAWHTTGVMTTQLVEFACIGGIRLAAFAVMLQWWTAPGQNTLQVH